MVAHKQVGTPSNFIADRPKAALCFGSLVILDVACCYLWVILVIYKYKIGKKSC